MLRTAVHVLSCSIALTCDACTSIRGASPRPAPTRPPLEAALRDLDDEGYEGGLDQDDQALVAAIVRFARLEGAIPTPCTKEPSYERVGEQKKDPETSSAQIAARKVGAFLEAQLDGANRRRRDIIFAAVAELGPSVAMDDDRLWKQGAWSYAAGAALRCESWGGPDVFEMWSPERTVPLSKLPKAARKKRILELMWTQLFDRSRRWPPGVFLTSTTRYELDVDGLGDDELQKLRGLIVGESYPAAIREQAIWMTEGASSHRAMFEAPLLEVFEGAGGTLADEAGFLLLMLGSAHGERVLSKWIASRDYEFWRGWLHPLNGCERLRGKNRLLEVMKQKLGDAPLAARIELIVAFGCLGEPSTVPLLLAAIDRPYWSEQLAAVRALARWARDDAVVRARLEAEAERHWSVRIRDAAREALVNWIPEPERRAKEPLQWSFHRRANKHGLPVCHGEEAGDGTYVLPGQPPFMVRWNEARVHPRPDDFPLVLRSMPQRDGEDYGTNTYLRVPGGWLFGSDLWHYDGDFGFVSDAGVVERLGPKGLNVAFVLETQFGLTLLGEDYQGDGGVLAVLEAGADGRWSYEPVLELPSEAFGYAFAPDGTLLVRDPYGAVAITRERRIVPLECQR